MEADYDAATPLTVESLQRIFMGPDAAMFRDFEARLSAFCPFEAIGMVRQEIRHAHFLAFLLDPNRPHNLGISMLEELIYLFSENDGRSESPLAFQTVYFLDFSNAEILRERKRIDLLLKIPAGRGNANGRGLIVAIEMKVDAGEKDGQLKVYRETVKADYPADEWVHAFVFLTPDGRDPSQGNEDWVPVSLPDLAERLIQRAKADRAEGEGADLLKAYWSMLRRHLMDDPEVSELAAQLWKRHREALEQLVRYRPDLQGDSFALLESRGDQIVQAQGVSDLALKHVTSARRNLRYVPQTWLKSDAFRCGDESWIEGAPIMALELYDRGGTETRVGFVIGPGDESVRSRLYQGVLDRVNKGEIKIGRRTEHLPAKWKHLTSENLRTAGDYTKALNTDTKPEEYADAIQVRFANFVRKYFPIYDEIVKQALAEA
ncbi:PD-(D/E)XK nuclease family protein [Vannielia litorea]|uniref:PDDEXK-like family protein n=1 Tax=Vannielia litorea TaxID=1217970 RepID=UPI001BD121F6|nr:PD-(D/E)XK nuclease family protein [Vannielia litorea]